MNGFLDEVLLGGEFDLALKTIELDLLGEENHFHCVYAHPWNILVQILQLFQLNFVVVENVSYDAVQIGSDGIFESFEYYLRLCVFVHPSS